MREPRFQLHVVSTCILCGNDFVVMTNETVCPRCKKVNP